MSQRSAVRSGRAGPNWDGFRGGVPFGGGAGRRRVGRSPFDCLRADRRPPRSWVGLDGVTSVSREWSGVTERRFLSLSAERRRVSSLGWRLSGRRFAVSRLRSGENQAIPIAPRAKFPGQIGLAAGSGAGELMKRSEVYRGDISLDFSLVI